MDDNTSKLIETLAAKLGTTGEHLWGVLIKQAPISAAFDIAGTVLTLAFLIGLMVWICRYKLDEYDDVLPKYASAAVVAFILVILTSAAFDGFQRDYAAFYNPEYWALHEVLKNK